MQAQSLFTARHIPQLGIAVYDIPHNLGSFCPRVSRRLPGFLFSRTKNRHRSPSPGNGDRTTMFFDRIEHGETFGLKLGGTDHFFLHIYSISNDMVI
jgi:hypothetical protein